MLVTSCPFIKPMWKVHGQPAVGCSPLSFVKTLCWTLDLRHILPALLVCTPAGNGTELSPFLLPHLWPSFRPFLVFLAICLTSRVVHLTSEQHQRCQHKVDQIHHPKYPFMVILNPGLSQELFQKYIIIFWPECHFPTWQARTRKFGTEISF